MTMKQTALLLTLSTCLLLSACQSLSKPVPPTTQAALPAGKIAFHTTGKIGITTHSPTGRTAGSAFYTWAQEDERFTINLTGVLGMGATQIRYDGHTATLTNHETTLTADNPNELLLKATGWHAPIDKLPYWVMGQTADGDTHSIFAGNKLAQSTNGDWTATFDYKYSSQPSRISMTHRDNHKVIMTINHSRP